MLINTEKDLYVLLFHYIYFFGNRLLNFYKVYRNESKGIHSSVCWKSKSLPVSVAVKPLPSPLFIYLGSGVI